MLFIQKPRRSQVWGAAGHEKTGGPFPFCHGIGKWGLEWWGGGGGLKLRTAYFDTALFLVNASLDLVKLHMKKFFELILLRNGKFYSLDKING